jgi:hypothetical protein
MNIFDYCSRVRWLKTFLIALLSGILAYPIAGSIGYLRMRAFLATPNHPRDSVGPDIAWIVAIFWSFVVFVIVFAIGIFVFKKREA